MTSGWFYTVNHEDMGAGADTVPAKHGDVLRWQFSLVDWGADLGLAWDGNNVFTPEDKTALIAVMAQAKSCLQDAAVKAAYNDALAVLEKFDASESDIIALRVALSYAMANMGKTPPLLEKWHAKLPYWMWGVVDLCDFWQYVILFVCFGWLWFLY